MLRSRAHRSWLNMWPLLCRSFPSLKHASTIIYCSFHRACLQPITNRQVYQGNHGLWYIHCMHVHIWVECSCLQLRKMYIYASIHSVCIVAYYSGQKLEKSVLCYSTVVVYTQLTAPTNNFFSQRKLGVYACEYVSAFLFIGTTYLAAQTCCSSGESVGTIWRMMSPCSLQTYE